METPEHVVRQLVEARLETFLSGMETVQVRVRVRQDRPLETFLSGLDKELERSCPKNPRDTRKSSGKAS